MDSKRSMLIANISDLSGNLKLIDTKISILLAAAGVLFNVVIACRSNILKAYNSYLLNNNLYKWIYVFLICCFVAMFLVFIFCGLTTIFPKKGKSRRSSVWFFDVKLMEEKEYKKKINQYTEKDIIDCLSSEVYKLNAINGKKIAQSRKAMVSFMAYVVLFVGVLIMTSLYYI